MIIIKYNRHAFEREVRLIPRYHCDFTQAQNNMTYIIILYTELRAVAARKYNI